jgi:hypothetical protein
LQKLGTLTARNIADLNNVMRGITASALAFAPVMAPPTGSAPTGTAPAVGSAMDIAGLDAILQRIVPTGSQSSSLRKLKTGDSIPAVELFTLDDGRPIFIGAYSNVKNATILFAILGQMPPSSGSPMFSGEVLKDRLSSKLMKTILGQFIPYGKDLTDKVSLAEGVPAKGLKGANYETYITRIGRPMYVDVISSGAGINDHKKIYHKNHKKPQQTGLRAIKLGSGMKIKNDPYKMYNEELGLNPISAEKEKKIKIKKEPTHKIKNGIDDGDEYAKYDDKENRYVSFGKFAINMRQLKKCVLQVVYKSLAVNPNFPPKKISTELQQYLFELLANKKSMMSLYKHIPEEEKIMLERLAVFSGVFDKLNIPKINALEKDNEEMERFKMLHGEFIAGNDNASMIRELRNLILKFLAESKITKAKAYDYLLELNNA